MMGQRQVDQAALFYEFSLEPHVPAIQALSTESISFSSRAIACGCSPERPRLDRPISLHCRSRLAHPVRILCAGWRSRLAWRRRNFPTSTAWFSRRHDDEAQLYAFDILALEGDDLRKLPLHLRKNNLARLLARRPQGISISEFEQGEIGPDLFRKACEFGLEGIVSKHRDRAPAPPALGEKHPAMNRIKDARRFMSRLLFR
jgi:hypothetical protein